MPLSTDTNFRSGKRGSTPLVMQVGAPAGRSSGTSRPTCTRRWPRCRARRCAPGPNDDAMSPLPMWKWIGSPASCAIAHSGSQCASPRYGSPKRCGSPVKRMPRWPGVERSARPPSTVCVDVPERRGHDRDEPAVVGRRPVAQEVVVRAHAHELELVVGDAEEALAAEAGDVRVEHLRPDARPRPCTARRASASYDAGWHSS